MKYWVCKSAPGFIYEAMECLGGNGYVEESMLPRLYREAPVNAIWEGSGNVMCLDVLRALAHEGEAARAVLDALAERSGRICRERGRPRTSSQARCAAKTAEARRARRRRPPRTARGGGGAARRARRQRSQSCSRARGCEDRHGAMYGTSDIGPDEARRLLDRACCPRRESAPAGSPTARHTSL